MRTPMLAGNWKLNNNIRQSVDLVESLHEQIGKVTGREVVVCPVFTALYAVGRILEGKTIKMGGQDVYFKEEGAFTGEVAPAMLRDVGCAYVIIGHSERRKYFGETDEIVNKKALCALDAGLGPIICIGETLEEMEAGKTQQVVAAQTRGALRDFTSSQAEKIVVAYEPVWAIGTGRNDSPSNAQKTIAGIRTVLAELFGDAVAGKIRILYGGSVKAENIDDYMRERDIDGALVGGASLKAESFARIVNFQE